MWRIASGSLRMICWRPAKPRATDSSSKARRENPASALVRRLAPMSRHDWFCGAANGTGNAGAASETDLSNGDPVNDDPDRCGTPSQSRLPAVPEAGTSTGRRTTSPLDWPGSAPPCPGIQASRLPLAMICAGPSTPASRTLALQPRGCPTFAASAAISLACCSFSATRVTKWIDPTVEVVQLYLFIAVLLQAPTPRQRFGRSSG